jgi:hypothetical protein
MTKLNYATEVVSTGDPGFLPPDAGCCTSTGARAAGSPQQYPVDQTGAGGGAAGVVSGRGRRGCKCFWIALAVVVLVVVVK